MQKHVKNAGWIDVLNHIIFWDKFLTIFLARFLTRFLIKAFGSKYSCAHSTGTTDTVLQDLRGHIRGLSTEARGYPLSGLPA